MEREKTYMIYTDASFDTVTKLGTYAIVIMQENTTIRVISKKSRIQMSNSTECEIFAIYQAINIILSCYINKNKMQKFRIKTDCVVARDFFIKSDIKSTLFQDNIELYNTMKQMYKTVNKKLSKNGCSFTLKWVPRELNKIAHKYSYSTFKKIKVINYKNEVLVIDRKAFFEILTNFSKRQYEIMIYLYNNSNNQNVISMTQKQISKSLNMSISSINKSIKELIKLNIIEKVKNGKYAVLI